jgi:circadian clock protein KaiC
MDKLKKSETGIRGLDLITKGGLPSGRPSLICGSAGSGKTLFGLSFIVNGIELYGEPGVVISFEERPDDMIINASSLGWDLQRHIEKNDLVIDYVYIERSEIEETGYYNLDGLFIRIAQAVNKTGAKRILIDTLESLFSGFSNEQLLRAEIRRLFKWLKDKGLTAVITAEAGENTLTRWGLEEYLSDFVISLQVKVVNNIATRSLRLVKYRGSAHGTDEFPFLITPTGFSVLPLTEVSLEYGTTDEMFSSGVGNIDEMLGNKGLFRGSILLITGSPGSGKTLLGGMILNAACERGETVMYVSFEESRSQLLRNFRSIGIDLNKWIEKGLFLFGNFRPTSVGIESHLIRMIAMMEDAKPSLVFIDPVSSLSGMNPPPEARSMLLRILHYIQSMGITCILTEMTGVTTQESPLNITSMVDAWFRLELVKTENDWKKIFTIMKVRGLKHSGLEKELVISDRGIDIVDLPAHNRAQSKYDNRKLIK